jgi:excisionase family DNA binding protein
VPAAARPAKMYEGVERMGHASRSGYMTATEVAAILHVTPKTVSRWAKEGKLPYMRTLGGHRRFPADAIEALARELQMPPSQASEDGE